MGAAMHAAAPLAVYGRGATALTGSSPCSTAGAGEHGCGVPPVCVSNQQLPVSGLGTLAMCHRSFAPRRELVNGRVVSAVDPFCTLPLRGWPDCVLTFRTATLCET